MDRFEIPRIQPMERPPESAQFTGPASVEDVTRFVRKYRPYVTATHSDAMRTLEFSDDDGDDLKLELNDLVVYFHGNLTVMPPALFLPVPDETG